MGMARIDVAPTAVYELPLVRAAASAPGLPAVGPSLPASLLLKNALWFCRLRWIVVAILGTLGVLGLVPGACSRLGLLPVYDWPLVAAGVLALGNLGFSAATHLLKGSTARRARLNLWAQVAFDLAVLTGVVHFAGSLETNVAFAYLFHIVLACIFLSRGESLAVTLIACVLYTLCVAAEGAGLLAPQTIYAGAPVREGLGPAPWAFVWNLALALGIWLAVWYLTTHLTDTVRRRDRELAETNRRLEAALDERSKHMLRTTHELKAPFAAIHATTQVLLSGQCGPLPDEAAAFIGRISTRCRRLASEIQDMVQLANLRSESQGSLPRADLDVAEIVRWCIAQIQPLAEERRVVFANDIRDAWTTGVEDHVKMLFANVIGNAVTYSRAGGTVRVQSEPSGPSGAVVVVEDEGIGIPAAKLPHIFEEYYRTDEAVRHNTQSSGLGLAIVRHVAQAHGIRVRVESRLGVGTRFQIGLPPRGGPGVSSARNKETDDGLPVDC